MYTVLGLVVILLHLAGPAFCPEPSSQLVPRYSTGQEPRLFSQMQGPLPLPASTQADPATGTAGSDFSPVSSDVQ